MKFKDFTNRLTEVSYPILIKDLKNIYKESVKVWVSMKSDTNELFLDIEGEPQFYVDDIDKFGKAIKDAKRHIQKNG